MKFSEDPEKSTLPGRKAVYRLLDDDGEVLSPHPSRHPKVNIFIWGSIQCHSTTHVPISLPPTPPPSSLLYAISACYRSRTRRSPFPRHAVPGRGARPQSGRGREVSPSGARQDLSVCHGGPGDPTAPGRVRRRTGEPRPLTHTHTMRHKDPPRSCRTVMPLG